MDSSAAVCCSVEVDAFLGWKIRVCELGCEGQVVFNGTGWGYRWIVNTGIHRAGSFVAWGRLQLGDCREPGCSRDTRQNPGPLSRGARRASEAGTSRSSSDVTRALAAAGICRIVRLRCRQLAGLRGSGLGQAFAARPRPPPLAGKVTHTAAPRLGYSPRPRAACA